MIPLDTIVQGDCLEVMKEIPDKSIDLVLTDPPYGINKGKIAGDEDLNVWIASIEESYRVLKDDAFYLSFVGISNIPTILNELTKKFSLKWMDILYVNNGMVRSKVGFSCYIPLLILEKGKGKQSSQVRDVIECSTSINEMNARKHPYQKDLDFVSYHIEHFSRPDGIVFDPFLGSGTTAVAAKRTGRHFIGIELSPEYCEIARKRVAAVPARLDRWAEAGKGINRDATYDNL